MVEKETTTDYHSLPTKSVKKWKSKKFRLAHFLVALVLLVVGGLLLASYANNQYNQSMVTNQLIGYNMCYQFGLQTNGIQAHGRGMPSALGTDEIVPVTQTGVECGINTEQGWIDIAKYERDWTLPLCLTDEVVSDWELVLSVYGGYEPHDGKIIVHQKGCAIEGVIDITWKKGLTAYCGPTAWRAEFDVDGVICLDSNQYPELRNIPAGMVWECAPGTTIPEKDVEFLWVTCWTGCKEPNQAFAVISVQNTVVPG